MIDGEGGCAQKWAIEGVTILSYDRLGNTDQEHLTELNTKW